MVTAGSPLSASAAVMPSAMVWQAPASAVVQPVVALPD
jgi:hypothetical protein